MVDSLARDFERLPFDEHILPEGSEHLAIGIPAYWRLHRKSVEDLEGFWAFVAGELEWFKPWSKILDASNPPFYRWFVGGELNISYLGLDLHVKSWRRNKLALIWEGEPVGESVQYRVESSPTTPSSTNTQKPDHITLYHPSQY